MKCKDRKNLELNQDELAEKLFVTRQAVSHWKTGETTPSIDTLKLMSSTFNVSIDELLGIAENSAVCQSCAMHLRTIEDFGKVAECAQRWTDYPVKLTLPSRVRLHIPMTQASLPH